MNYISLQRSLVTGLFSLLLFIGCQPTPTYNPFDNQFYVSSQKLVQDGCDTVMAECGYYNLVQKTGRLKTYYQFYDSQSAVAKGCFYTIDTLQIKNYRDYYDDKIRIDSLLDLPFNIVELDKGLDKFGYRYLDRSEYEEVGRVFKQIKIVNEEIQDTLQMDLNAYEIQYQKECLIRILEYFTVPKKSRVLMYEDRPSLSLEEVSRKGIY